MVNNKKVALDENMRHKLHCLACIAHYGRYTRHANECTQCNGTYDFGCQGMVALTAALNPCPENRRLEDIYKSIQ